MSPRQRRTYSRTLQRACAIVGGIRPLAGHLRVAPGDLACWIDARAEPPLEGFLASVDLVLLHAERGRA